MRFVPDSFDSYESMGNGETDHDSYTFIGIILVIQS